MFANAFQSGFLSIFYSVGSTPLGIWDKSVKNGHIRRIVDEEVKSLVLEIAGTNVATTYITCPIKPRASLGIKLPFLVMVVKNMKKYFTFEIQIIDDKDMRRRFRVSNFQSTTKVRPFCTTMPIGLSSGWNQIQFNLADFTRRAYGTVYIETVRVQIHANVRIRRIYFSDRLYSEEELPSEYKLFMPLQKPKEKDIKKGKASAKDVAGKGPKSGEKLPDGSPSGGLPTATEQAEEQQVSKEEREVGATSIEPSAGDIAPIEDVETDRGDADIDESMAAPPPSATQAGDEETDVEGGEEGGEPAGEVAEGEATDAGEEPPAEEGAEPTDEGGEPTDAEPDAAAGDDEAAEEND